MGPTGPDPTGGQPVAPLPQNTVPLDANIQALQSGQIANANQYATDINAEPTLAANQRALIFGNDPTLNSLESAQGSKIQELFAHDQFLSQQYGGPVAPAAAANPDGTVSDSPKSASGAAETFVSNPTNPGFGKENPLAAGYILDPYTGEEARATQDAGTMKELTDLQNETQQRRDVLGNVLQNVLGIYKSHLDSEKALSDSYQQVIQSKLDQATQAREARAEGLAETQAGYQYDPTTGKFGIMGLDSLLGGGAGGTGSATSDRAQFQAIVNGLPPQSPLRQSFENMWQQQHGTPLFPQSSLAPADITDLGNATETLRVIDNVLAAEKKYGNKFPTGWLAGIQQNIGNAMGNAGPALSGLSPEELKALNNIKQLQGLGDRQLIGGRLTGYLLNALGPAFPSVQKGQQLNVSQLTDMRNQLIGGLNSLATKQGFNNSQELLQSQNNPYSLYDRASIVSNLKSSGWNDDKIHAYLRAKGIDG